MSSPFRRHKQQVLAIRAAPPARPAPPDAPTTPEGREYAALRVLLHDNLRLADIQSHEARVPSKAEFARAFDAWIEGALAAGDMGTAQDDILVTVMLWAIDYRDFPYALRPCHPLPSGHARLHPLGRLHRRRGNRRPLARPRRSTTLLQTLALVTGADMPDPVMAKLYKAIGRSFARKADAFDPAQCPCRWQGRLCRGRAQHAVARARPRHRREEGHRAARTPAEGPGRNAPDFHEPPRLGGRMAAAPTPCGQGPAPPPLTRKAPR
jgi:hypothetical protein